MRSVHTGHGFMLRGVLGSMVNAIRRNHLGNVGRSGSFGGCLGRLGSETTGSNGSIDLSDVVSSSNELVRPGGPI